MANQRTISSFALIKKAVCENKIDDVKNLINTGIDINAVDMFDGPPLAIAVEKGHAQIVDILLDAKADPEKKTHYAKTALAVACTHGHIGIVKRLVSHKANIEAEDSVCTKNTPLILAASSYGGHPEVVEFLVQNKANVNAKNSQTGKTALSFAVSNRYLGVMPFLKDSLETKDDRGRTPLFVAIERGYKDVVERLVLVGANINETYRNEGNAFEFAVSRSNRDVINFLHTWMEASHWLSVVVASTSISPSVCKIMMEYVFDINLFLPDKISEIEKSQTIRKLV